MSTASKEVPAKPALPTPHIRTGEKRIVFCYDVACPYAYVASRQVGKLASDMQAKLEWWPVLLSRLHTLDATPENAQPAVKLEYMQRDLRRQAARLDVPLRRSKQQQGSSSLAAMQAIAAAPGDERLKLTHELFKRRWVDDEDVSSEAVIAAAISACGIDPTHINRTKGQDALSSLTQKAYDMGAFGTPTFFVYSAAPSSNRSNLSPDIFNAPTMLYGLDRLPFVRHALGDDSGLVERITADPAVLAEHKPQVELFIDLSSPFSFLAHTQLHRLQHLCDVTVTPVAISGLLKALQAGAPVGRLGKNGAKQYHTDLQDWADFWHEPCTIPPFFPFNGLLADRCILVEPRLTEPLFRAAWQRSLNISEQPRLLQLIAEAGFNADEVWRQSQQAAVKERLKANGDRALALGVFGVPTFVYEGEVLFGQDRMDVLMDRLSGWKGGREDWKSGSAETSGKQKQAGDGKAARPTPAQRKGTETDEAAKSGKQAQQQHKSGISSKL